VPERLGSFIEEKCQKKEEPEESSQLETAAFVAERVDAMVQTKPN
jgi:hypothetical protein